MQIPKNELTRWLLRTFSSESGEYREMLQQRIEDLINREIDDESLEMYLKSGGWNPDIALVYREFKTYMAQQKQEKEKTMADEMISKAQAKQALRQMLRELAQASGYDFDDTEELSAIRTNFATYLRSLKAAVDLDLSGLEDAALTQDGIDMQEAARALEYLKEAEKTLTDAMSRR